MTSQFDLTEDQIAIQDMVFASNWDDAHCCPAEVRKAAGMLDFGSTYSSGKLGGVGAAQGCVRHSNKEVRLPC
jgi:hypothetical protein